MGLPVDLAAPVASAGFVFEFFSCLFFNSNFENLVTATSIHAKLNRRESASRGVVSQPQQLEIAGAFARSLGYMNIGSSGPTTSSSWNNGESSEPAGAGGGTFR
jgi:hypothetical protein